MRRVFADTSFFVAVIGPRDVHHDRAIAFMREYDAQVLTTDFVLVEFGNYLFRIKDRPTFEPVLQNIRTNTQYEIVAATRELLERGIQRYVARPDKEWSLTDCISFVVMEEHRVTEALTSDGDFEQAGFTKLL
jgi:uncharacterized protein